MSTTAWILLLWVAFGLTHMGLSSVRTRPLLIARLGEQGFLGVYSLVSLAIFVPLVWVYFADQHAGPALWMLSLTPFLRWVLYAGMGIAFILLIAGALSPSPASIGAKGDGFGSIHLITRHPVFMAVALFGVLHLVPNGFASDVAFFGGLAGFSVLGSWHQDRRKLETGGESFRTFYAATPFFPFTGRDTLRGLREFSPLALGIGIAVTVVLRYFHHSLF